MGQLEHLLQNNRAWARNIQSRDKTFFERLSQQQSPDYFWIGCSDSRVPANTITGLLPGEVFVHRNVANLVKHADMNCLSAMQFAVDVLKVKHIIICGHYGCGGVQASMSNQRVGLSDNWIRQIHDTYEKHRKSIDRRATEKQRFDHLCELNVIEQVANACQTTVVQDAWLRGQELTLHGWIYGVQDGLLHDLQVSMSNPNHAHERISGTAKPAQASM